jgi:hypothetical protein
MEATLARMSFSPWLSRPSFSWLEKSLRRMPDSLKISRMCSGFMLKIRIRGRGRETVTALSPSSRMSWSANSFRSMPALTVAAVSNRILRSPYQATSL